MDSLHTLTGVSLRPFCIMQRIAALIRKRRASQSTFWDAESLLSLTESIDKVEKELDDEKLRLQLLVSGAKAYSVTRRLLTLASSPSQTTFEIPSILSRSFQNILPSSTAILCAVQPGNFALGPAARSQVTLFIRSNIGWRSSRLLFRTLGHIHLWSLCRTWRSEDR